MYNRHQISIYIYISRYYIYYIKMFCYFRVTDIDTFSTKICQTSPGFRAPEGSPENDEAVRLLLSRRDPVNGNFSEFSPVQVSALCRESWCETWMNMTEICSDVQVVEIYLEIPASWTSWTDIMLTMLFVLDFCLGWRVKADLIGRICIPISRPWSHSDPGNIRLNGRDWHFKMLKGGFNGKIIYKWAIFHGYVK